MTTPSAPRLRALVFAPLPPPTNGQSRVTGTVVDALSARAAVEIVNTSDPSRVWRRPGRVPMARMLGWTRALASFRRALRETPDVVYLTPASSALGLARDVLSVGLVPAGVPVVAHVHVGDYARLLDDPRLGPLARRTAQRFSRVMVPSAYAAQGLADRMPGVPIQVVPNTVPADVRVTPAEVEAKWARPRRAMPHVAYLSHMIPSKGYRHLAEAAHELERRREGPVRMTFAGGWPSPADRRAFEAELAQAGVANRWSVVGPLAPRAVRALLLDADAFAFPSVYPHESFGLVVLEAMNAGCGVAAVRHAAIAELISDGVEGRLSPPGSLADALTDVLADRERYGRAAAARVRDAFEPARIEAALVQAVLGLS